MQNPLKATVTGVKEGKATVTFTASDGRYAKCEITVKNRRAVAEIQAEAADAAPCRGPYSYPLFS